MTLPKWIAEFNKELSMFPDRKPARRKPEEICHPSFSITQHIAAPEELLYEGSEHEGYGGN
jgi:hypothetical protein